MLIPEAAVHHGAPQGVPKGDIRVLVLARELSWPQLPSDGDPGVVLARPSSAAQLEALLQALNPLLILVDVALIDHIGLNIVLTLRRHFPSPDLIFVAHEHLQPSIDLIVRFRARGCVDWASGPAVIGKAIDAVLSGQLWFSRATMQTVYVALLEAMTAARGETAGRETAGGSGHGQNSELRPLTPRETEVVALVRQGLSNRQISAQMGISVNTVKKHLAHAFEKAGRHNRHLYQL